MLERHAGDLLNSNGSVVVSFFTVSSVPLW